MTSLKLTRRVGRLLIRGETVVKLKRDDILRFLSKGEGQMSRSLFLLTLE